MGNQYSNHSGQKDNTIGIDFQHGQTNLKEHSNSTLHSIIFSRELQSNKYSLLHIRCQDYMNMIHNNNNCVNELSNEIGNAVNRNHFNVDLLPSGNSVGRNTMNQKSFFNNMNKGNTSSNSFFSGSSKNFRNMNNNKSNSFFNSSGIFGFGNNS
jgi:hypothetical protein